MDGSAIGPILFLVFCVLLPLAAGYLVRRQGWLDPRWSRPILTASIAAGATLLVWLATWGVRIEPGLKFLPVIGALLTVTMLLVGAAVSPWLLPDRRSRASFAFATSLSNMGYSLGGIVVYALLGEQGYAQSIIFLIYWSPLVFGLYFPLARMVGRDRLAFRWRDFLGIFRDVRSLPLLGLTVGLTLNLTGVSRPAAFGQVISVVFVLASTTTMFAVGLSLVLERLGHYTRSYAVISLLKFAVAPLVAVGLVTVFDRLFGMSRTSRQVVLILSACPVAVYSVVISTFFDLDVDLANSLWVVTTVVFLIVVLPALVLLVPLL